MQFEELLKRERKEGQQKVLKLIALMTADGKADELPKLESEDFYKEMLKKYNL